MSIVMDIYTFWSVPKKKGLKRVNKFYLFSLGLGCQMDFKNTLITSERFRRRFNGVRIF